MQASIVIAVGEDVISGARTIMAAEHPAFSDITSTRAFLTRE